jgi:hypothetical protein
MTEEEKLHNGEYEKKVKLALNPRVSWKACKALSEIPIVYDNSRLLQLIILNTVVAGDFDKSRAGVDA